MRKIIAIFLTVIYSCFITGTLWSAPLSTGFFIEHNSKENNKQISEPEPCKDFEAPHFSKVVKILPVKIKLPRSQNFVVAVKQSSSPVNSLSGKLIAGTRQVFLHSTPIFIRNSVFRI
jgi:hypothetical protein